MSVARRSISLVFAAALLAACADENVDQNSPFGVAMSEVAAAPDLAPIALGPDLQATLVAINAELAARGAGVAVRQADMVLAATADPQRATTVFANDRTLRIGYRFVKDDPRRDTQGGVVRQASFTGLMNAPALGGGTVPAKPAIDASFNTWSNVQCGKVTIENNALPPGVFNSQILAIGGFINDPFASDINTVGFIPGSLFDAVLGPGASQSVLAVTFPFVFVDEDGNPTDIDGDGNDDAAFAEIWYNAAFPWTNTGASGAIDIETVALHENGHALGLGHFGKIAVKNNGTLQVAPRAVMNAIILGTLRSPLGTDNGAFCGNWANW